MVQYSEAIYNIIRRKIQDIEDVNNYKTISETLLSTNTNFDEKVNQLYTYLKNEGVNISKIKTLIPNQELLSALNKCYKNIDNIINICKLSQYQFHPMNLMHQYRQLTFQIQYLNLQ